MVFTKSRVVRFTYCAIFTILVIFAFILRDDLADNILQKIKLGKNQCPNDSCLGKIAVLRISLALFVRFLFFKNLFSFKNSKKKDIFWFDEFGFTSTQKSSLSPISTKNPRRLMVN